MVGIIVIVLVLLMGIANYVDHKNGVQDNDTDEFDGIDGW